ncbi:MAG: hypothetical protein E7223_01595 [Clostridiales bacterium]|nr:hypothetical protein [Clostridiales bacterium]
MKRGMAKNLILILCLSLLALGLVSCGPKDPASQEPPETVVASLDGEPIFYKDLEAHAYLYSYLQNLQLDTLDAEAKNYIMEIMLQDLVSMEAMKKTFRGREGEVLTAEALQKTADFLKTVQNDPEDAAYVKQHGITEQQIEDFCNRQHFATAYVAELEAGITDLDQRIADYYEKNKDSYKAADTSGDVVQLSLEQVKNAIKTIVLSEYYKEAMEKLLTETYKTEYLL